MRVSVDAFVASPGFGGFISYIGGLCAALAGRGDVELDILLPAEQEVPEFADLPASARIHRLDLPAATERRPGVTWTDRVLPAALDELSPEVHLGPAFMLPPGHARPQAVTVHDDMFERFPQFYGEQTRAYLREQTLRALAVADVVLAVSESTREDAIERWAPRSPVVVTPLAPRLVGEPGPLPPAGAPPSSLLNVGGAHRRKRLDDLIEAFSRAATAGAIPEDVHLVLIGVEGDERVRSLRAASPVPERILLTGRIPDAELPAWYRHCELFVYPSEYEGFGLGPLEAMASSAPVLTYRNSALAEVLGGAAAFADPGVDGLSRAIVSLLGDRAELERMRERGSERSAAFTWDRTAETTVRALRGAIDRFAGSAR
ncbi:glycosyltransferase family 4 protein [Brachybacterium sp. AOP43-C2-M15]|uniref:glycosyltransferase family 4 protein n=1 Tax=Brachybacterium sp. AOP43-C2-M15 TaxID=3457661 RepID=UPI004033A63F